MPKISYVQKVKTVQADSDYMGKIDIKKNFKFFFQCLALPKDPQFFAQDQKNVLRFFPFFYLLI